MDPLGGGGTGDSGSSMGKAELKKNCGLIAGGPGEASVARLVKAFNSGWSRQVGPYVWATAAIIFLS